MADQPRYYPATVSNLCIDVFHHAAVWVIGHAMDWKRGLPLSDIEGLTLYADEIDVLGVPLDRIIRRLAEHRKSNTDLDGRELRFWNGAIRRFAYRDSTGNMHHAMPGEFPSFGKLHHIELVPEPKRIPFGEIMNALERLAQAIGQPLSKLLFRYKRTAIRDATTLLNQVRVRDGESVRVIMELDYWYDTQMDFVNEEAAKRIPPFTLQQQGMRGPEKMFDAVSMPLEFRYLVLPRPVLARFLRRDTRTLLRWDKDKTAPGGRPWTPGTARGGNRVEYRLADLWPTIADLMERQRDPRENRRWLAELGHLALEWNDCKGDSILDEIIDDEDACT